MDGSTQVFINLLAIAKYDHMPDYPIQFMTVGNLSYKNPNEILLEYQESQQDEETGEIMKADISLSVTDGNGTGAGIVLGAGNGPGNNRVLLPEFITVDNIFRRVLQVKKDLGDMGLQIPPVGICLQEKRYAGIKGPADHVRTAAEGLVICDLGGRNNRERHLVQQAEITPGITF